MGTRATSGRSDARRLVRTVFCAYDREELPTAWLQVFRRFEQTMQRAGLRVRVRLAPLQDPPESFEVLIVPPELAERAVALGMDVRIVTVTRAGAGAAAAALVRELLEGSVLFAEARDPDDPTIVVRRGPEVL